MKTKKILKHWALFYKNGERHFINAPTRKELDSAIFGGAYAPSPNNVTYYVEYERDIKDTQYNQVHEVDLQERESMVGKPVEGLKKFLKF
jgi:hypothetical protein|tara:strand:+ start:466 stop:735 length:270 start_codon:yes stop_codon:yes gene_type:complete